MVEAAVIACRAVTFGSIAILSGGLFFLVLVWPEGVRSSRMRKLLRTALLVALVATSGTLLLHGPNVMGGSLTGIFDVSVLQATMSTTFGTTAVARLVMLLILGLFLWRALNGPKIATGSSVMVAVLIPALVSTQSFSGHAAEKGPLALGLDMTHLVAASMWLGGLVVLVGVLLPSKNKRLLASTVPAFSVMAFSSVVVLTLTGGVHAVMRIGSFGDLLSSDYGRLMLVKFGVFVVLLGFGGLSHRWTQRRFAAKDADAQVSDNEFRKGIRRTAMTEVGLGVVILGVTAVLVATSPPMEGMGDMDMEHPPGHEMPMDHSTHG